MIKNEVEEQIIIKKGIDNIIPSDGSQARIFGYLTTYPIYIYIYIYIYVIYTFFLKLYILFDF